ncbi:MAG: ABC transporter ATP-binding protein [Candidatus Verstraetearchaeota archaeon]|nr:ABC transporter ATP-binding protein [Candidatus Verstraetearchaeota archaeon]
MIVLERDLCFSYGAGAFQLEDINLEVRAGEVVTLLGPNGSGKTTLLYCIAGLYRPQREQVLVNGKEVSKLPRREAAKIIGFVPQDHHPSFPYLSLDVVAMGRAAHLGLLGSSKRRDLEIARRALEAVGAFHLADRIYTQVSGGERQLILIARALAQEPKILLDEPTAHLDFKNQVRVLSLVKRLVEERKLAAVLTLHDPNLASMFSDRIALMNNGRLAAYGPPEEALTAQLLRRVYQLPVHVHQLRDVRLIIPEFKEVLGS